MKESKKEDILIIQEAEAAYNSDYMERKHTYQDILDWNDGINYEIIDGVLFVLDSPGKEHQMVSMELSRQIANYLVDKSCIVFAAPSDVKFTDGIKNIKYNKVINSVQPDIYVVCDGEKLDGTGILGSPDLIIEILSPGNKKYDKMLKYHLYQKNAVKEYWIVDYVNGEVEVFILNEEGVYTLPRIYDITEEIKVNIFENLIICLKDFYEKYKELLMKEV